jgi:oxaloacetate decarboxylase alpha subunit
MAVKMLDFLKNVVRNPNNQENTKKVEITELVLRDAHQSLFATRMRIDDMLPIADKLDKIGYWSMESWGGATFDACIRYLGEDPWDRQSVHWADGVRNGALGVLT